MIVKYIVQTSFVLCGLLQKLNEGSFCHDRYRHKSIDKEAKGERVNVGKGNFLGLQYLKVELNLSHELNILVKNVSYF